MILTLERRYPNDTYTIGRLLADGKFVCNTLEDRDRGLRQSDSLSFIKARKVYGETAIPTGEYEIRMDIVSPKYSASEWYARNCNGGRLPRLVNVPGFEGVLVHPGNTALDTLGCILVGENKIKGRLVNSRNTFARLYSLMKTATDKGEKITILIG